MQECYFGPCAASNFTGKLDCFVDVSFSAAANKNMLQLGPLTDDRQHGGSNALDNIVSLGRHPNSPARALAHCADDHQIIFDGGGLLDDFLDWFAGFYRDLDVARSVCEQLLAASDGLKQRGLFLGILGNRKAVRLGLATRGE